MSQNREGMVTFVWPKGGGGSRCQHWSKETRRVQMQDIKEISLSRGAEAAEIGKQSEAVLKTSLELEREREKKNPALTMTCQSHWLNWYRWVVTQCNTTLLSPVYRNVPSSWKVWKIASLCSWDNSQHLGFSQTAGQAAKSFHGVPLFSLFLIFYRNQKEKKKTAIVLPFFFAIKTKTNCCISYFQSFSIHFLLSFFFLLGESVVTPKILVY